MTARAARRSGSGARRAAALCVAAAMLWGGAVRPAPADEVGHTYQVSDDEAVAIAVGEFRRHADAGEWVAALEQLRRILEIPPGAGVVVAVPDARPPRYEDAWNAGLRLLESLPAAGRQAWEEQYRRHAEDLLDRGVRLRRAEDLLAAARRYPVRDVRRRAHDALAHLATASGDFDLAARELDELLECSEPDAHPQIRARLAFVRAQTGDAEGVVREGLLAGPRIDAGVRTPEGETTLRLWVAKMKARAEADAGRFSTARRFGGDRHGDGISEPPPLRDASAWPQAALTDFRRGEENDDTNAFVGGGTFHPVVPLVAQGTVYVSNGRAVKALELGTGRPAWIHATRQRSAEWRDHPNAYCALAYSEGTLFAPLASRADAPDIDRTFFGRTIIYSLPHRVLYALDARTGDVLWSHESERLAGREDAAAIEQESVASSPLVVGDDVIVVTWKFSVIYQVQLVCFDRRTGATKWRTPLVRGQQEMNLFGRPVKEISTPPPAEMDGVVYCATGLGIAAAVDRVTGSIVWLAEYPVIDTPPTTQWYETRDRDVVWRPSPVTATRVAVLMAPQDSASLVAFDPRTGARLWEQPGERFQYSDEGANWFLGVKDGRAYTMGFRARAVDVATGRNAWSSPEAGRLVHAGKAAGIARGRPLLSDAGIDVPTDKGIVRIHPATGQATEIRPLPGTPPGGSGRGRVDGDLVSGDGALLVVQERVIDCYYRFEDLARRLRARLAASPEDPQIRLEAGDVFRASGDLDEAVSCYEHGVRAAAKLPAGVGDRVDAALRRALVGTLLDRALTRRVGGAALDALADLERATAAARDRGDAVRALFALADCAADLRKDAVGDGALRRIQGEFGDVQTNVSGETRVDAGALAGFLLGRRAAERGETDRAVDVWLRLNDERPDATLEDTSVTGAVRTALADLAEAQGDAVVRRVEAHARKRLEAATKAQDWMDLHRIARTCPSAAVAAEAALTAADLHLAAGRARDAAAVLEALVVRSPAPAVLARGLWSLHEAYRRMDEVARERGALRRILQDCPDERLPDGRGAGEAARTVLAEDRFRDAPALLPDPVPPLRLAWDLLQGTDASPILHVTVRGAWPAALGDRLLFIQDRELLCVPAESGATGEGSDRIFDPAWSSELGVDLREAYGTRDSLVVVGDDREIQPAWARVDSIDASDGSVRWTRRLGGQYRGSAANLGMVYVLRTDLSQSGDWVPTLTVLSAESGDVLAERKLEGRIHQEVTCAADAVLVYEILTDRGPPRRRVHTLDATTLSPRGIVEIEGHGSQTSVAVPGTAIVATRVGTDGVVGIDATSGATAWPPFRLGTRAVKSVLAVPNGILLSDDADRVHRLDPATGRPVWTAATNEDDPSLSLLYDGETAEGDLVVATVGSSAAGVYRAVGLASGTGEVRWRVDLPVSGRGLPHPVILQETVAYAIAVRSRQGFDCKVVYLSRADGRTLDVVRHPVIGRSLQTVHHRGRWLVLSGTPRADVAVYGGAEAK